MTVFFCVFFTVKDFSTSSMQGEVAIENAEDAVAEDGLSIYQISERKRWEQRYLFLDETCLHLYQVPLFIPLQSTPLHILQSRQNKYNLCGVYGPTVWATR